MGDGGHKVDQRGNADRQADRLGRDLETKHPVGDEGCAGLADDRAPAQRHQGAKPQPSGLRGGVRVHDRLVAPQAHAAKRGLAAGALPNHVSHMHPVALAAIAAAAVTAGGVGVLAWSAFGPSDACPGRSVFGASIGGSLDLIASDGSPASEADVIQRPTLVYFGYTFCPDFCPLDLNRNADALDLVDAPLDMVFITVDPRRDTPEVVGAFAAFFHDAARGYSGTEDQIAAAARAYGVLREVPAEPEDDLYLVGHTTLTYLMHPEHGILSFFNSDEPAEAVAEATSCHLNAL